MDTGVQTGKNPEEYVDAQFVTIERFPRKKLSSASAALKKYTRAVLEASMELSEEFHTNYLDHVVKGTLGKGLLDVKHPATSYETLKKGFLHHLNTSGKYLVIREHLREAVCRIIQQKSLINHANGFKNHQEYQNFLHDSYCYMLDAMNEALASTTFDESPDIGIKKCSTKDQQEVHKAKQLRNLLLFADEAFYQSDYENAHRLHVERVARSGDSDECWIHFALMWLSRGDERLAEIAVREALTQNPMNIVGLLSAGLIAAAHHDDRAISFLETALKQRPLCPELHILLATVYNYFGNHNAAEPYYETARRIHRALTAPVVKHSVLIIHNEESLEEETDTISSQQHSKKSHGSVESGKSGGKSKDQDKRKSKAADDSRKASRRISKKAKETKNINPIDGSPQSHENSNSNPEDSKKLSHMNIEHGRAGSAGTDESLTTGGSTDWGFKITKANIDATKPPSLGNCLVVTWNVTKKQPEKLLPPEFGDEQYKSGTVETFEDIKTQFNMILEAEAKQRKGSSDSLNASLQHDHKQHHHRTHTHHHHYHRHHKKPRRPSDLNRYSTFEELGSFYQNPNYDPIDFNQKYADELRGEIEEMNNGEALHTVIPLEVTAPLRSSFSTAMSDPDSDIQIHSQRHGSEFLWTAQLLLKLRQFNFLDHILSQEISRHKSRGIDYLYLRAVSLHLRGRDKEALDVIDEAIKIEPKNATLWILQGHAFYNLREKDSALASYERAMMLPHGKQSLHLAYLRFGTLCIDKGDHQLAKRVFLKRISVTPSPYVWISIGNVCYHLGELEDALYAFGEANKLDNSNPIIWAHLSLISLVQGKRNLAEQAYKWAIRFGFKKCRLMDDIHELHHKLGYGNSKFPKIPQCLPHEAFVERLGRKTPLEVYANTLNFPHLKKQQNKFENRESEEMLIKRLQEKDRERANEQERHLDLFESDGPDEPLEISQTQNFKNMSSLKKGKRNLVGKKVRGSRSSNTMPSIGKERRKTKSRINV